MVVSHEISIHVVERIKIIWRPASNENAVNLPFKHVRVEGGGFLDFKCCINADSRKLRLEVRGDAGRIRIAYADGIPKDNARRKAVGVSGLCEECTGLVRIGWPPRLALAAVGDNTRHVMRGRSRAGGEECFHDARGVDCHRNRLTHTDIIKGLERSVDASVERGRWWAGQHLIGAIKGERCNVVCGHIIDAINDSSLKLHEAGR